MAKLRLDSDTETQTVTYDVRSEFIRLIRTMAAQNESTVEYQLDRVLKLGLDAARVREGYEHAKGDS